MFEVKVYTGPTLAEGADIAVKARLWVIGWCLRNKFLEYYSLPNTSGGEIAIGYLDGEPICVVAHDGRMTEAFCRKALRRNGYTSQCIAKLSRKNLFAEEGVQWSLDFWRKNGVDTPSYSRF